MPKNEVLRWKRSNKKSRTQRARVRGAELVSRLQRRRLFLECLERRDLLAASVFTDLGEYSREQPVVITAEGFQPGETVAFQVQRLDTEIVTDPSIYEGWQIVDGSLFDENWGIDIEDGGHYDLIGAEDGRIQTYWSIGESELDGGVFEVTATGQTSGIVVTSMFSGVEATPYVGPTATVSTDKDDYQPGEWAVITADGFEEGETIVFHVLHTDDTPNTGDGHEPWSVLDGGEGDADGTANGRVQTEWLVAEDDSLHSSFEVTANGLVSGQVATAPFTDALSTLMYDNFQTGVISSSNWSYIDAELDRDNGHQSGPHADSWDYLVELDGDDEELRSRTFDMSNYTYGRIIYQVQQTGHENPPEASDRLRLQFKNRNGSWVTIRTETIANNPDPTVQTNRTVNFYNDDAFHSGFQFRFNAYDSDGAARDDWYVDAVGLYGEPNRTPTASASGASGTRYDHQTNKFSWSISDADQNLEHVSATVKRGSATTNTYSWSGSAKTNSGSLTPNISQFGLGEYKLNVTARDARDKTATASRTFTVIDDDTAPPEITLGGSTGSERHTLDQQFYWSVFDSGPNLDPEVHTVTASGVAWAELELTKDGESLYQGTVENPNSDAHPFVGANGMTLDDYVEAFGPGAYTLTVIAQDGDNDRANDGATSEPVSRTVTVTNDRPRAIAGLNQTVTEGHVVSFSGESSYDVDGEPVTYAWEFGDGGASTEANPTHVYTDNGSYRAWLTVTDQFGSTSRDRLDVTVLNSPPILAGVANDGPISPGQAATITVTASDVSGDELLYEFDFDNDGVFDASNASGVIAEVFPAPGIYPINVRVTDDDGGEASSWTAVTVGDAPAVIPVVEFSGADQTVSEGGGMVILTATLSEPAAASALVPVHLSGTATHLIDYSLPFSYFAFAPGETTAQIDVAIRDDASDEFDEDIVFTLGDPLNATLGADSSRGVTIVDDDSAPIVSFTERRRIASEGVGRITLLVRVDEPSGKPITIPLEFSGTAEALSDYSLPDGAVLSLDPHTQSASLSIDIIDDDIAESNQSILVAMDAPTNATASSRGHAQLVLIPANDAPAVSFTSAYYGARPEPSSTSVDVILSSPFDTDRNISISTDESDADEADFEISTTVVSFAANEVTTEPITVDILDDQVGELRESVVLTLETDEGFREGAIPRTVIDIVPNDTPHVTLSLLGPTNQVWEGQVVTLVATLTQASEEWVEAPIVLNGGSVGDFRFLAGDTIRIQPGATFGMLDVLVNDDLDDNGHRTLQFGIGSPLNAAPSESGPVQQTIRIRDDEVRIQLHPPTSISEQTFIPGVDIDGLSDLLNPSLDDLDLDELAGYELGVSLSEATDHAVNATLHFDDLSAVRMRDLDVDPEDLVQLATDAPDYVVVVADFSNLLTTGEIEVTTPVGDIDISIPMGATSPLQKVFVIPTPNIVAESTEYFRAEVTSNTDFPDRPVNIRIRDNDSPPEVHLTAVDSAERLEEAEFALVMDGLSDEDVTVPIHWVHETIVRYSGRGKEVVDKGTFNVVIPAGELGTTSTITWEDDIRWERDENIRLTIGKPTNAVRATWGYAKSIFLHEIPVLHPFNSDKNGESEPWQMDEYRKDQIDAFLGKSIKNAIIPGSGDLQAEVTYRWFGIDGNIDQGAAFFDGNKNGLIDFLDLNQDGIQDPNEPSEPVGVTALDGSFEISIPIEFDVNEDGVIGLDEGRLMIVGGRDASRDANLQFPLIAPVGSAVVTPLTTLMTNLVEDHAYTLSDAKDRIREAFQLPDADFTQVNPVSGSAAGDANAARFYAMGAMLHDTYTQVANLAASLPGAPSGDLMAELFMADLSDKIASPDSQLKLSHPLVMQTVVRGVLEIAGLESESGIVEGGAQVIAASNQYIESIPLNASVDYLTQVAQAQVVAQGDAAAQLAAAGAGEVDIATVVAQFTGEALVDRIHAATTGLVATPHLSIADAQAVESDSGQSVMEFTVSINMSPTMPVSVNYRAMRDSTATAGVDFEQVSGTLHWTAGDSQTKTIQVPIIGDTQFEPDEQFRVLLGGAVNAVADTDVAYGLIINDDVWSYTPPEDGEPNQLQLIVDTDGYTLFRNGQLELRQEASGDAPIVISGAAGVSNELIVEFAEESGALNSGLTFVGAGANDRLELISPIVQQVSHEVTGHGDGVFTIDDAAIAYEGIEELEQALLPEIVGLPTTIHEADSVTVHLGAELHEGDSVEWVVTHDESVIATGTDFDFSFTPNDDGLYYLQLNSTSGSFQEGTVRAALNVANVAPVFEAGGDETLQPQAVGQFQRTGIAANDPGADILSGSVDFGDGVAKDLVIHQETGMFDLHHTYASSGLFTVQVTVEDEDGGRTIDSFELNVILAEIEFTSGVFVDPEGTGLSHAVTLERSPASASIASQVVVGIVGGSAEANVDYDAGAFPLLLTFAPGVNIVSVPVPLLDDSTVELNETIHFEVTAVSNAAIASTGTASLTINNDDLSMLNVDSPEADEGGAPLTFTASLTNPVDTLVTVQLDTQDGTATIADGDYTPIADLTLTFEPGVTSQTFAVPTSTDRKVELDETFAAALSNLAAGGRAVLLGANGAGVIKNDDDAAISIGDVSQLETDGGVSAFEFHVTLSEQVDFDVTLEANTSNGTARALDSDFRSLEDFAIRFPAASGGGAQLQTVTVEVDGDVKVEPHEWFELVVSSLGAGGRNVTVADGTGLGEILNDDFLSGRVFDDRRNNGQFDAAEGDLGISGVEVRLIDEGSNATIQSKFTDDSGWFVFDVTLDSGSYRIVEIFDDPSTPFVEDERSELGMLDGRELAGVNGGVVNNSQDSNVISNIEIGSDGPASTGASYLFAELHPASAQGLVWEDFDNDAEVDYGELVVDDVLISINGVDDRGDIVSLSQRTDTEGIYEFTFLRPGSYSIAEQAPTTLRGEAADFLDGLESLGEVEEKAPGVVVGEDGEISGNDEFTSVVLVAGSAAINYNFGERLDSGHAVEGTSKGIGFWQNKNGRKLIESLNGGASSTLLGQYLTSTFPQMYGDNGTGFSPLDGNRDGAVTNSEVADTYRQLFKRNGKSSPGGPPKLDAQVMAIALATYATKESLVSIHHATDTLDPSLVNTVSSFGLVVSDGGLGSSTFNIGDAGAAFGLPNGADVRVIDLLLAVDERSHHGLLFDMDGDGVIDDEEELLRVLAHDVFAARAGG